MIQLHWLEHIYEIYCFVQFTAGGLFEGGLFDEAPMGEVPVPEVSAVAEPQEPGAVPGPPPSVHDESEDEMGDRFGGPPSPMGGSR